MKVKALFGEDNTGILSPRSGNKTVTKDGKKTTTKTDFEWIEFKKGRYLHNGISHPLKHGNELFYIRTYGLECGSKKTYWLDIFASHSANHGHHVGFTWREHQIFLWLLKDHWLQKEANIRYIVNIIFLILGVFIGLKQI